MESLHIRGIQKSDFDFIVGTLDEWWAGPAGQRAHPYFFYEWGDFALVAESNDRIVGFLLGFVSPRHVGYVHLVGIDPEFRRKHVGRELYARFAKRCRADGATTLKAIAALGNEASVRFHEALGFVATEVADYAGPNRPRMVFELTLESQQIDRMLV